MRAAPGERPSARACSALPPVVGVAGGEGEGVGGVGDETLCRRLSVDRIALRRLCRCSPLVGHTADRRPTARTHESKCVIDCGVFIWNLE